MRQFVFGLLPGLLSLSAFVMYNVNAKKGTAKPNPVSWFIWSVQSILNAWTYFQMRGVYATTPFFVGALSCTGTFLYVLYAGKFDLSFRKIRKDLVAFVMSLVALYIYWSYRTAQSANLINLAGFMISSEPTITGVRKDPSKEKPLPWAIWTIAFTITGIGAALDHRWLSLITPVGLVIIHGAVMFFSSRRKGEAA